MRPAPVQRCRIKSDRLEKETSKAEGADEKSDDGGRRRSGRRRALRRLWV